LKWPSFSSGAGGGWHRWKDSAQEAFSRREASIVIEPLGPVGLVVDVVCHFLEVLEVGPEGQRVRRERGVIRGGEEETNNKQVNKIPERVKC